MIVVITHVVVVVLAILALGFIVTKGRNIFFRKSIAVIGLLFGLAVFALLIHDLRFHKKSSIDIQPLAILNRVIWGILFLIYGIKSLMPGTKQIGPQDI